MNDHVTASTRPRVGERPLGAAGAILERREQRLRGAGLASHRLRGHAVDADDADDLLDEIGLDRGRPAARSAR